MRTARAVEVIAEVEHLLGTDHPANIAHRLGYASVAGLVRILDRNGRRDLAGHFHAARAEERRAA